MISKEEGGELLKEDEDSELRGRRAWCPGCRREDGGQAQAEKEKEERRWGRDEAKMRGTFCWDPSADAQHGREAEESRSESESESQREWSTSHLPPFPLFHWFATGSFGPCHIITCSFCSPHPASLLARWPHWRRRYLSHWTPEALRERRGKPRGMGEDTISGMLSTLSVEC